MANLTNLSNRLSKPVRMALRFLLVWFVDAVSLIVTAALLPGMAFVAQPGRPAWLGGLLTLNGADSFYEQRILRLAQQSPFAAATQEIGLPAPQFIVKESPHVTTTS